MIRSASLQSLLDRGTDYDYAAILQCIDRSSTVELDRIRPHASRMREVIDQGLASSDPEIRQRALWTIAKMEVESHFRVLIDVVCDPDDPQQMVAIELTSMLVKAITHRLQEVNVSQDTPRLALMAEFTRGLESYPTHRVQTMFDWWVATAQQDDEIVLNIIREANDDESYQRIVHHLERSKTKECLELVATFLWSRNGGQHLALVAASRNDAVFVEVLGSLCRRFGLTKELAANLNLPGISFRFLNKDTFEDQRISVQAKISLVELMTLRALSTEEIMPRIHWLLQNMDSCIEEELALLIDHQKPLNADIAVIALSDALDSPDIESSVPPPWKQSMRESLEGFISAYDRVGSRLQVAIANFFRDFKCEKLLEKLMEWPVAHLTAYARLSRIADSRYLDILAIEMDATSPVRRQRGIRAAHIYGMDRGVEAIIVNKLDDPVDEVRIEAINALADAINREQAIIQLSPLEVDSNPDVHQAAERSLMKLRGEL